VSKAKDYKDRGAKVGGWLVTIRVTN
jgi:hypothetical protein